MRVPDLVKDCVVFLYVDDKNHGMRPGGTAFVVGRNDSALGYRYLVTARHVIESIGGCSTDGAVHIRYNTEGGQVGWVQTNLEEWHFHPTDEVADVAVLPFGGWHDAEYALVPISPGESERAYAQDQVGIGDDVFVTGLFVNHTGSLRNEPVIRGGLLAALPTERVKTRRGEAEVYLVELRSAGGLSGSPAFVHLGYQRVIDGQLMTLKTSEPTGVPVGGKFYLLGVVQGHWDIDTIGTSAQREVVNMGMSIVTPARKIEEVVFHREPSTAGDTALPL